MTDSPQYETTSGSQPSRGKMDDVGDADRDPTQQTFYAIQEWPRWGQNSIPDGVYYPEPRSIPSEGFGQVCWMSEQQRVYHEQDVSGNFTAWSPQTDEYCFQPPPYNQASKQPSDPWSPPLLSSTPQPTPNWQPPALAYLARFTPQASSPTASIASFATKDPPQAVENQQQQDGDMPVGPEKPARRPGSGTIPTPPGETSEKSRPTKFKHSRPEDSQSQSGAPNGPERKKYRVKNRAAAKRCRDKSRQYEIDLAAKERQVTEDRAYLQAAATSLRDEILGLKQQILQHGDCDCAIIQAYISKAANDFSMNNGMQTGIR